MGERSYRCFFCEEVFRGRKAAHEHFGDENCTNDVPACIDPLRTDEQAQMKAIREGREFYFKAMHQEERADDLAYSLSRVDDELERYFGEGCRTTWQAGDRYNNLLFENKMLREQLAALPAPPEANQSVTNQ
jgi:hypothetical protein